MQEQAHFNYSMYPNVCDVCLQLLHMRYVHHLVCAYYTVAVFFAEAVLLILGLPGILCQHMMVNDAEH